MPVSVVSQPYNIRQKVTACDRQLHASPISDKVILSPHLCYAAPGE